MRKHAPLVLFVSLVGCVSIKARDKDQPRWVSKDVFYGTNRRPTGHSKPEEFYGAEPGDLSVGVCRVKVSTDRRMERWEGLRRMRIEFGDEPRAVEIRTVEPLAPDAFIGRLTDACGGRAVFVFVHGYNVEFDEAVGRTAQLAYDLAFDGAPACFSWPSQGTVTDYRRDERMVETAVPHLQAFLEQVCERSGASCVHVIAHSMGNRALTKALCALAPRPLLREAVFCAPDVDAIEFAALAAGMRGACARMTLYASENDKALAASKAVHGGRRAGDAGHIVVEPGLDSIDVSAIDTSLMGHSYYADNSSVLADLFMLFSDGRGPTERGLEPRTKDVRTYWVFRR